MTRKPSIAVIGPGRLGSALVRGLADAGYPVAEVVAHDERGLRETARRLGRFAERFSGFDTAELKTALVWLCVPDAAIAGLARELARRERWNGRIIFHASGALSSRELQPLRRRGAATASVHPMMSFVPGVQPRLRGVPFAIEGDAVAVSLARRIARDLGGEPLEIAARSKSLYHAWGAFASPLLVALLAAAEEVAGAAGVPERSRRAAVRPMIRQTIENYFGESAAAAFSGPMVRGDVETVRRHLQALRKLPQARAIYVALARSALRNLPATRREDLARLLQS